MKKIKNKRLKEDHLLEDDVFTLHKSKGNGTLRRQIWVDSEGKVTRYRLAYINHHLFTGDNGRILGYDNAHGYHHKHYMGKIEPTTFKNFSELEEQFQKEFEVIHEKAKKKR
jgi:hypothetical protein